MLITTENKSEYWKTYKVFDTETGIKYHLDITTKCTKEGCEPDFAVGVFIQSAHKANSDISSMEYAGQEAIDFWDQLKGIDASSMFIRPFFFESLAKAIQKLDEMKGIDDEN